MSDAHELSRNYSYARSSHAQFTGLMQGMGVFHAKNRYEDGFTLRENVAEFLKDNDDQPLRAIREAYDIVPSSVIVLNYAEQCVEGNLAGRIAPLIAAKSLLYTGIAGNFDNMNGIYEAYKASMAALRSSQRAQANETFVGAVALGTAIHSDLLIMRGDDDEERAHYAMTLRRLLTRGAITDAMYMARIREANLKPASLFSRKLRTKPQ